MQVPVDGQDVKTAVARNYTTGMWLSHLGSGLRGFSCSQKKSNKGYGVPANDDLKQWVAKFVKQCVDLEYIA